MRINWFHLLSGITLLALGAIQYSLFRPSDSIILFRAIGFNNAYYHLPDGAIDLFLGSAPAFLHVCAFSSIIYALVEIQSIKNAAKTVCFWVAVNLAAEFGQLARSIDAHYCQNAKAFVPLYFCNGTFDINDLVFALIGGVVAFIFLLNTRGVTCKSRSF